VLVSTQLHTYGAISTRLLKQPEIQYSTVHARMAFRCHVVARKRRVCMPGGDLCDAYLTFASHVCISHLWLLLRRAG
jgi:hypothetical protein